MSAKFTLQQALKAQIRNRCTTLPSFNPGVRKIWVVYVTPRSLYPLGKRIGSYCGGGWGEPGTVLDGYGKARPIRL